MTHALHQVFKHPAPANACQRWAVQTPNGIICFRTKKQAAQWAHALIRMDVDKQIAAEDRIGSDRFVSDKHPDFIVLVQTLRNERDYTYEQARDTAVRMFAERGWPLPRYMEKFKPAMKRTRSSLCGRPHPSGAISH